MTAGPDHALLERLTRLLRTPAYEQEARTRLARLIDGFAAGMLGATTVVFSALMLIQPSMLGWVLANLLRAALLFGAVILLNHRHRQRIAAHLLLFGPLCLITYAAWNVGGVRSPGVQYFFVLSLMAALLLGERAGLMVGLGCVGITFGLALAESLHVLPPPRVQYGHWVIWALNAMYVGYFVIALRVSMGTLHRALEEVEAHRRHLEELVARRTEELRQKYDELAGLSGMRDTLVHMLVHDLRSPLTSMSMALDLLQMKGGAEDETLATCASSARHMISMVTAVLDVNKLEAAAMELRPAACDLAAVARGAIDEMRGLARGVTVTLDPADAPVPALADRELVERVIQNLLANALKHSPAGGRVRIRLAPSGEGLRVSVSDEGPGVPPEARQRIFDKFGALAQAGSVQGPSTGLGLAFCRMAVEAHGGAIGVEAGPGGTGSTFWFTLPQPVQVTLEG